MAQHLQRERDFGAFVQQWRGRNRSFEHLSVLDGLWLAGGPATAEEEMNNAPPTAHASADPGPAAQYEGPDFMKSHTVSAQHC